MNVSKSTRIRPDPGFSLCTPLIRIAIRPPGIQALILGDVRIYIPSLPELRRADDSFTACITWDIGIFLLYARVGIASSRNTLKNKK